MSKKLKQWIEQYGIWNVIAKGFYEKSPIQIISPNRGIRIRNWHSRCKQSLKKQLILPDETISVTQSKYPNTIWWLWLQGAEQAPKIVRKCLASVEYYAKQTGFQVIKLDENNLFDYVKLPENIVAKWKSGKMANALFSDLCRIDLIVRYGGFWIDSTVLMTGTIDSYILNADMFFFQSSFLDLSETRISNWFLYAKKPCNPFFTAIRETLLNWWQNHSYVNDYFIFHLITALVIESKKYKDLMDQMPFYNNSYPTLLQIELKKTFDATRWDFILTMSHIHKLTYKISDQDENTVFHHILNYRIGE